MVAGVFFLASPVVVVVWMHVVRVQVVDDAFLAVPNLAKARTAAQDALQRFRLDEQADAGGLVEALGQNARRGGGRCGVGGTSGGSTGCVGA